MPFHVHHMCMHVICVFIFPRMSASVRDRYLSLGGTLAISDCLRKLHRLHARAQGDKYTHETEGESKGERNRHRQRHKTKNKYRTVSILHQVSSERVSERESARARIRSRNAIFMTAPFDSPPSHPHPVSTKAIIST